MPFVRFYLWSPTIVQVVKLAVSSSHNFHQLEMMEKDYYIYVKRNHECTMILTSYVDDIMLIYKQFVNVIETKNWVVLHFCNEEPR